MVEKEEHRKEEMVPRSHYGNDIDYAHHATHIFTAIGGSEKTQNVLNGEDHDTGRVQAEKDQLKNRGQWVRFNLGGGEKQTLYRSPQASVSFGWPGWLLSRGIDKVTCEWINN